MVYTLNMLGRGLSFDSILRGYKENYDKVELMPQQRQMIAFAAGGHANWLLDKENTRVD